MAVTGSLTLTSEYSNDTTAGSSRSTYRYNKTFAPGWTVGSGAGQFSKAASATGSLSTSTNTHTLSAFAGIEGTTAFAAIKELWILNTGAVTITVTPGGSQPWLASFEADVNIPAGGAMLLVAPTAAGWVVASGSADKFTVTATGVATYELQLKGI